MRMQGWQLHDTAAKPSFCNLEARSSVRAGAKCPGHSQPVELTPPSKLQPGLARSVGRLLHVRMSHFNVQMQLSLSLSLSLTLFFFSKA